MLSPIDLAVVVVYVLGTTVLGAWFVRRQRDARSYFVGDRNVRWPLVLISIVATETSTLTFLSVPGLAYREGGNLAFLQLALGYALGRVVVAVVLLPAYFRGEWFTAYQLLRQRFSPAVQRTTSALFLVTRTVGDGLRLFLTAILIGQFTGWGPVQSVLAMALVTLVYTYLGGMEAVIWTDLVQFVVYILGAILAGVVLLRVLPGGWDAFLAAGQQAGKFTVFDLSPDPARPYTLWAGLAGGAFVSMASHGADQIMVQRYLCARSLGQARAALLLSGGVVLAQFSLFLLLGVGLFALNRSVGLESGAKALRPDEAFGAFIVGYLPRGLVGLVVAAVLAAAMSTLSSSLNSSAGAAVFDFYRPLRPDRSERHYLQVSRRLTVFWGLAQTGVALVAVALKSPTSVIEQVMPITGFTTGGVLGLFLLGQAKRPVGSRAALGGLAAGFLAVLSVWLPTVWGVTLLAWPWYAPLGTLTTVAVAVLADKLRTGHGSPADGGAESRLDEPG